MTLLIGYYVLPKILERIANNIEFVILFSIAWCLALASALHFIGLSIEIGALLAGVSLSISPYRHEIANRIRPLRDFFLLMFFVFLGTKMEFTNFSEYWLPISIFSIFVLIGNPLIVMSLMGYSNYTKRTGFLAGLTVAQISEFSLIIVALGIKMGPQPISDLEMRALQAAAEGNDLVAAALKKVATEVGLTRADMAKTQQKAGEDVAAAQEATRTAERQKDETSRRQLHTIEQQAGRIEELEPVAAQATAAQQQLERAQRVANRVPDLEQKVSALQKFERAYVRMRGQVTDFLGLEPEAAMANLMALYEGAKTPPPIVEDLILAHFEQNDSLKGKAADAKGFVDAAREAYQDQQGTKEA